MQFGVSLSAIAQQPVGADMQQAFADICTYVGAARDLGFDLVYQGQHYLTDPYQQLQTMPLLARISAEARSMGLVATMLVPLHHRAPAPSGGPGRAGGYDGRNYRRQVHPERGVGLPG